MANAKIKDYFRSVENSISKRLLGSVLSIYFVLTLIVTVIHIAIEYHYAKRDIERVLVASENTFHDILTADLWNYDYDQLNITSESIMRLPYVVGLEVFSAEGGKLLFSGGETIGNTNDEEGLFWSDFSLDKNIDDAITHIGDVRIYSNRTVVVRQIESGIYSLIVNAIIKTIALVLLVIVVFNRLLTRPLGKLARHADSIDPDAAGFEPIHISQNPNDELGVLQTAINGMMEKIGDTINKLDTLNKKLEERVLARTEQLRETVDQLGKERSVLRTEVDTRKKSQLALARSLQKLKHAQNALVESEKMASLGQLAAGVAHEINNPISYVQQNMLTLGEYNDFFHTLLNEYKHLLAANAESRDTTDIQGRINDVLHKEDLEYLLEDSVDLIESSVDGIKRVAEIVKNMKTFCHPDEEARQEVNIHEVIEAALLLSQNETKYIAEVEKDLQADNPVVPCNRNQISQVFLNMIVNAAHAVGDKEQGVIRIHTENEGDQLLIHIIDNGCGIPEDKTEKIFEPFYTSKSVGKGTGLGLSISYGIIKKHNGGISVASTPGKGTRFTISLSCALVQ